MRKTYKILLTLKVFLPILIKGITQLIKECIEAQDEQYIKELKEMNNVEKKN